MRGKQYALAQLAKRRESNLGKEPHDNSKDVVGMPMRFPCLACNADVVVPENYIFKSDLCSECQALKSLGWLE